MLLSALERWLFAILAKWTQYAQFVNKIFWTAHEWLGRSSNISMYECEFHGAKSTGFFYKAGDKNDSTGSCMLAKKKTTQAKIQIRCSHYVSIYQDAPPS